MRNVRDFLGDMRFPASKADILNYARQHNAPVEVIKVIEGMRDKRYDTVTDVTREVIL